MAQDEEETIPLNVLLANISGEVERLGQMATQLDDAVGTLADVGTAAPLANLQNIDALRQSLEDLARITHTAADLVPEGSDFVCPKTRLAQDLKLERVRDACLRTANGSAFAHELGLARRRKSAPFLEEF